MAIFHLNVKPISRGKGRSVMGASAYHSASSLHDIRLNLQHNYSKKEGVVKSDCFYFHNGEKITLEREQLWNIAELSESASNARTAREIVVNIPHELNEQQRKNLIDEFAVSLSKTMGVAIDYSIHLPSKDGDDRNHHAHIMMTTRNVVHHENGFSLGEKTDIELSNKKLKSLGRLSTQDQIVNLRQDWELLANEHLFQAGKIVTIDHRSHKDQGLDILPTVKLGPVATAIERNRSKNLTAATSKMGDFNREIATYNEKFIKFHNLQIIRAFMPRTAPTPPTPFDPPKPVPVPAAEIAKPKPPAPAVMPPPRPAPKPIPPFVSLADLMHLEMSMMVSYQPVNGWARDETKTGIDTFANCVQTLTNIESGRYKKPVVQEGRYPRFNGGRIEPKEILSLIPQEVIASRNLNEHEKLVLQNIENQLKGSDGVALLKDIALMPVAELVAKYPALGVDVTLLNVSEIRPGTKVNVGVPPPEPLSMADILDHDQHQQFTEDTIKAFSGVFRTEESKQKFREDMAKERPAPEPQPEKADTVRAEVEQVKPPAEVPATAVERVTPAPVPRPKPRGP